jgi:hypothetical protein
MAIRKTKRQKPKPYDFLAIPLRDGSLGLGEFIGNGNLGDNRTSSIYDSPLCVLYGVRESSLELLRDRLDNLTLSDVVGLAALGTLEIQRGIWLVIGNHASSKFTYLASLPKAHEGSYTGEIFEEFLEAYHSLRSWNDYPMAPIWFREILLPHLQPPSQKGAPAPKGSPTSEVKPMTEPQPAPSGPAQVHVTITYAGEGLPSVALLRKRRSVEAWIEREHLGEVTDAGGGGGVMDIFVDAPNARKAITAVREKLDKIGWGTCTKIEFETLDESD